VTEALFLAVAGLRQMLAGHANLRARCWPHHHAKTDRGAGLLGPDPPSAPRASRPPPGGQPSGWVHRRRGTERPVPPHLE
jgi:hypothetical protein